VVPNIYETSTWNLFHVTLVPRFLEYLYTLVYRDDMDTGHHRTDQSQPAVWKGRWNAGRSKDNGETNSRKRTTTQIQELL